LKPKDGAILTAWASTVSVAYDDTPLMNARLAFVAEVLGEKPLSPATRQWLRQGFEAHVNFNEPHPCSLMSEMTSDHLQN
jgi:hypothetical protein